MNKDGSMASQRATSPYLTIILPNWVTLVTFAWGTRLLQNKAIFIRSLAAHGYMDSPRGSHHFPRADNLKRPKARIYAQFHLAMFDRQYRQIFCHSE
jgi:hypothetical protein